MLQVKTEIHRDIEQRFRKAMSFVRQLSGFKFKRLSRREEGYFWHYNYSGITEWSAGRRMQYD